MKNLKIDYHTDFKLKVIVLLLLFLVALSGCRTRKEVKDHSVTETSKESGDIKTVNEIATSGAIIYKTMPVYYKTTIEIPCDDKGVLKPINTTIGSGSNKFKIFTDNGSLYVDAYIDSTRSSLREEFRAKFVSDSTYLREKLSKTKIIETEVVRTVWPWWLWIAVIGGVMFAILWVVEKFNIVSRVRNVILKV